QPAGIPDEFALPDGTKVNFDPNTSYQERLAHLQAILLDNGQQGSAVPAQPAAPPTPAAPPVPGGGTYRIPTPAEEEAAKVRARAEAEAAVAPLTAQTEATVTSMTQDAEAAA